MGYQERAVKGSVIVFCLGIIGAFVNYLVRVLYTRNMIQEDYGLFYAVVTLFLMLSMIKDFGLNASLVKFIPEFSVRKKHEKIKSFILLAIIFQLAFVALASLFLWLFSKKLSLSYFHSSQAQPAILLLLLYFFGNILYDTIRFSLQGFQHLGLFATMEPMRSIVVLVLSSFFFKLGHGFFSAIYAYVMVYYLLLLVYAPLFLKKVFPSFLRIRASINIGDLHRMFVFGIPLFLTTFFGMIITYTDTLMLTYYSGLTQVALYNVSLPTARLIGYFHVAIAAVLFPLTSELFAKKKIGHIKSLVTLLNRYILLFILPISLLLVTFPNLVITMLFGKAYVAAAGSLRILAIAFFFSVLLGTYYAIFSGIGETKLLTKITLIGALLNFFFNLFLIPSYGILGASLATLISFACMTCYAAYQVKNLVNVRLPLLEWSINLIIGIIFVLMMTILKNQLRLPVWTETALVIFIGGSLYLGLLFLFRLVNKDDVVFLKQTIGKFLPFR